MKPPIGFVILSHGEAEQLARLVNALNRTYDQPPITIHHDFSQCDIDARQLSGDVMLVGPSLRTQWAHISVVRAALAGLALLYQRRAPKWFTLLSATDYPTKAGREVVEELIGGSFDLYLDYQLVERQPVEPAEQIKSRMGTDRLEWRRMAYDRYVAKTIRYPSLTKRLKPTSRKIVIRKKFLCRPVPFSRDCKCYAGDHWFTGNRKVADILLSAVSDRPEIFAHFSKCFCPEESIYHTLLCNRPDIRVHKDNRRYTDWSGGGAHPKVLGINDIDAIVRSRCHFARKFSAEHSASALDRIDQIIGSKIRE
jgi:hypothetical protein